MVRLELPAGWSALTAVKRAGNGNLEITDIDNAVITVGSALQTGSITRTKEGFSVDIGMTGKWHFTAAEALDMAGPILSEYKKVFRDGPFIAVRVNILPFPRETQFGTWQAETRGNTVTIVSSDMAFRTHRSSGFTSSCGTNCFTFGSRTASA